MKNTGLKLLTSMDLGTVLPGHYGQSVLPLTSDQHTFLSLTFPPRTLSNGFFIIKEGNSECLESLNVVLKPFKTTQIFVGCYPRQVNQTTDLKGELIVNQTQKQYRIKLHFRIQVPKIICKKMLQDPFKEMKMVRLVVNKAVTSDLRIPLLNFQDYPLQLVPGLLIKSLISDKQNPFILKIQSNNIKVQPKQQFFVIVSINTNIGYKNQHKGLKKVMFRNVLTLSTNSIMIWCLPIEIIVVYVKQPQFKNDQ